MGLYYKATRPDGTDFYSGTIDYAAALASGETLRIDTDAEPPYHCCTSGVLHASDVPTETLTGGSWPCRLFVVTGTPVASEGHKYGFRELRVVREVEATEALGPQGVQVTAALIERARRITSNEANEMDAAWGAARGATWDAARGAARGAAWDAARGAARGAAWDAAWGAARGATWDAAWGAARGATWGAAGDAAGALVVRDLIGRHNFTQEHYDLLTGPWRQVIGPVHPDDAGEGALV